METLLCLEQEAVSLEEQTERKNYEDSAELHFPLPEEGIIGLPHLQRYNRYSVTKEYVSR